MLVSDYKPRQVLFWVNDTDHAFKFRNNNSANQTLILEKINLSTTSGISLPMNDHGSSLSTESIPVSQAVTEIPNWKQSFEKTLDSVFNRQKRFTNDSNESVVIDDIVDVGDFDVEGEHIDLYGLSNAYT